MSCVRAITIIRLSSGRHEPQFVPALSRAPTASVEHAPSAIAAKMAHFTPKHAQIVGLASKSADALLPAKRKRRAVPSSRPSSARPLHGGTSPSRPKKNSDAVAAERTLHQFIDEVGGGHAVSDDNERFAHVVTPTGRSKPAATGVPVPSRRSRIWY